MSGNTFKEAAILSSLAGIAECGVRSGEGTPPFSYIPSFVSFSLNCTSALVCEVIYNKEKANSHGDHFCDDIAPLHICIPHHSSLLPPHLPVDHSRPKPCLYPWCSNGYCKLTLFFFIFGKHLPLVMFEESIVRSPSLTRSIALRSIFPHDYLTCSCPCCPFPRLNRYIRSKRHKPPRGSRFLLLEFSSAHTAGLFPRYHRLQLSVEAGRRGGERAGWSKNRIRKTVFPIGSVALQ